MRIIELSGPTAVDGRRITMNDHPFASLNVPYSRDYDFGYWEFVIDRLPFSIDDEGTFIYRAHLVPTTSPA